MHCKVAIQYYTIPMSSGFRHSTTDEILAVDDLTAHTTILMQYSSFIVKLADRQKHCSAGVSGLSGHSTHLSPSLNMKKNIEKVGINNISDVSIKVDKNVSGNACICRHQISKHLHLKVPKACWRECQKKIVGSMTKFLLRAPYIGQEMVSVELPPPSPTDSTVSALDEAEINTSDKIDFYVKCCSIWTRQFTA